MSAATLQAAFVEHNLESQGDMPVSDSRFDKLQAKVEGIAGELSELSQRTAKIEGQLGAPTTKGVHPYSTVLISAVCIAIVSYWAWVGTRIVDIGERIAKVEASLKPLDLKHISSLDKGTFDHSLPQLRQVIGQVNPKPVVDRETLTAIANKLRQTDESTPDYWPTVLQFIQFASSATAVSADVPPPGSPDIIASNARCLGEGYGEQGGHCLTISHRIILLDGGDIPGSRFYSCRILFTQNPVRMRGVQFINCVFEMPVTSSPTPYLKDTARQLLASNLTFVSIPSS